MIFLSFKDVKIYADVLFFNFGYGYGIVLKYFMKLKELFRNAGKNLKILATVSISVIHFYLH